MKEDSAAPGKVAPNDEDVFLRRVRPPGWRNPVPQPVYDFAVIGAGPAGIAAAECAVRLGARVALIERNRLGGNSLNAGTVPSKAIIQSARVYAAMRDAEEFGAPLPSLSALEFVNVMARMRRIRTRIAEHHSVDKLAALGIDLFFGAARFDGADTLAIGDAPAETRLRFRKALLATGARPSPPDKIPGLEAVGYLTSATVFELRDLPRRLAVIGGGPLGCELAQAFCRLGSQVTIIQDEPKFLPYEERDAAEILSRSMARDGVTIRLNTTVSGARLAGGAKVLDTVNNELRFEVQADEILLSIGRVPNLEQLGLERAGIVADREHGLKIDDFLCTSNPAVYAAGDVCLAQKFTNAAWASGHIAARNALSGGQERHSQLMIPWCTYCDPEIAHIGQHVWDARREGIPIKSYTVMMHDVDRAITDGLHAGFVKIHVSEGTDRILGATIVASRASELINEISVIMSTGISMTQLGGVMHTYPAESGAILHAALAYDRGQHRQSSEASPKEAQPAQAPAPASGIEKAKNK